MQKKYEGRLKTDMQNKISYEEMVDKYYSVILGYIIKKIGSREDAEDLTQDIFLNCHKDWERFDPSRASISTWLFAITDNRLKNYYRDKKLNVPLWEVLEEMIVEDTNMIDCIINQEETKEVFSKVMYCLNERQKKAIYLRYFEQLKMDEISEKLQCSEENVRVIIHRAIKKMKRYAQEHGIEWSIEIQG